jgi:hypothetical protein
MKIVIPTAIEPERRDALLAAAPGAEWVNAPDAASARAAKSWQYLSPNASENLGGV